MWSLLARTLLVFVAWGALLAVALAAGLPQPATELAATAGAGLTLVVRGVLSRTPRRPRLVTATQDAARRASL